MEKKNLKQSLRDIFSFNWVKRGRKSSPGASSQRPKRESKGSYYRSPYSRQRTFWERNKDTVKVVSVIVIVLLMATCAGVDLIWKGDVGQGKGHIVDLYKSYDSDDNDYDYYASISWSGGLDTDSVTRGTWNKLHEGQTCTVHYVVGGITGMTWVYDVNYH